MVFGAHGSKGEGFTIGGFFTKTKGTNAWFCYNWEFSILLQIAA